MNSDNGGVGSNIGDELVLDNETVLVNMNEMVSGNAVSSDGIESVDEMISGNVDIPSDCDGVGSVNMISGNIIDTVNMVSNDGIEMISGNVIDKMIATDSTCIKLVKELVSGYVDTVNENLMVSSSSDGIESVNEMVTCSGTESIELVHDQYEILGSGNGMESVNEKLIASNNGIESVDELVTGNELVSNKNETMLDVAMGSAVPVSKKKPKLSSIMRHIGKHYCETKGIKSAEKVLVSKNEEKIMSHIESNCESFRSTIDHVHCKK